MTVSMTYACMQTIPATGAKIMMVVPGQFRLVSGNAQARLLMRGHGYRYDRTLKIWR